MKKLLATIMAVTIVCGLTSCITVTKKGESSAETTTKAATTKEKDTEADKATEAPETTEEETTTTEAAPEVLGVGSTAEINDVKITLQSASEGKGNEIIKPNDGKTYVYFDFEIENGSDSEVSVSSIASFNASFDDYAEDIDLMALSADSSKDTIDGSAAPGKKIKGSLGYAVSSDWKTAEIVFHENLLSDETVTFTINRSDIA